MLLILVPDNHFPSDLFSLVVIRSLLPKDAAICVLKLILIRFIVILDRCIIPEITNKFSILRRVFVQTVLIGQRIVLAGLQFRKILDHKILASRFIIDYKIFILR